MDPFTAALIISTVISVGSSAIAANSARQEQNRAGEAQRVAQEQYTRKELDVASQRVNSALAGAESRGKSRTLPSYGAATAIGSIPSTNTNTSNAGSSGTF